jgi:2-dehydro-3-deoxyphosphogluconate aldolase/(4S)-4-hydroxy-2-oxoglutarate aldolase
VEASGLHVKFSTLKTTCGIGSFKHKLVNRSIMDKLDVLNFIYETGVIAIMRAQSSEHLISAAEAIKQGGVNVIEITMTTPGALKVVEQAVVKFGDQVMFGVGSVLDAETARAAILAGSQFVVSPTLNLDLITLCNRYGVPAIPGCFTPTEILTAHQAGASWIKLFPASIGGPSLVKAILAPLPQVKLVPVGGVNLNTTADFIRSGAVAVGVGSNLIDQKLIDSGNWNELNRRAAEFIAEVRRGRNLID